MSGNSKKINQQLEKERIAEEKRRTTILEKTLEPTPEQERWHTQSAEWDKFVASKDYSKPPGILGYDLHSPAQQAKQRERMANVEGIGAAALGGDNSIALQQSRERNANAAAEDAGASYEQAIKGQDAYFKGQAIPYASLETNKLLGMLGNSTGHLGNLTQNWVESRTQSLWPTIIGGALGAAGSFLGRPKGA